MNHKASALLGRTVLELQWLYQDMVAEYPQVHINAQRKTICKMLALLERISGTTPLMVHRISTIRCRIVAADTAEDIRRITCAVIDLAEEMMS